MGGTSKLSLVDCCDKCVCVCVCVWSWYPFGVASNVAKGKPPVLGFPHFDTTANAWFASCQHY